METETQTSNPIAFKPGDILDGGDGVFVEVISDKDGQIAARSARGETIYIEVEHRDRWSHWSGE